MPRPDNDLPEGTDKIIAGASATDEPAAANKTSATGIKAAARRDADVGSDGLVSQVRDHVSNFRGQAGDKLRSYADDGKGRASGLIEELGAVLTDAARSVDSRLGEDYGRYAHQAASAVTGFAGKVRDRNVDDIVGDARDLVRKSPVVAIGIAAVAGFALIRVLKTGLDEAGLRSRRAANDDAGA